MRSHNTLKARCLQISSTKRIPAFTRNEIDANTLSNCSGSTWPDFFTAASTPTAVASAYASSCTGVAPASWRWYEHTFIGFHSGAFAAHHEIMSTINRRDGSGGKMYVPRDRYSLTMSFCVVPRSSDGGVPCSSAFATYKDNSHAAVALMVIDVFIPPGGMPSRSVRMCATWHT